MTPAFYPSVGGAETNVLEISKRLVRNGCGVTVITQSVKGSPNYEDIGKIEIVRCKGLSLIKSTKLIHLTTFISMLFESSKNVIREKPKIVHAHIAHYPLLIGILVKFFTGKKLFVTVHGSDLNVYGKRFPFKLIIAWALRRADKVIVVSNALGGVARVLGIPREKIIHISNGVDTEFFHFKACKEYRYDVAFFGGIKWMKGLDYLVDAVEALKCEGKIIKLAIAGDGPYLSEITNRARSKMLDNIVFLGKLDAYAVREVIWESRIIIFPSISEGVPCSLLEAMACSKPIIATNVGGIGEILENDLNGVLIPSRDSKVLAESILCVLEDQRMQDRLSMKAMETVTNTKDWNNIAEQIMSAYINVLNN